MTRLRIAGDDTHLLALSAELETAAATPLPDPQWRAVLNELLSAPPRRPSSAGGAALLDSDIAQVQPVRRSSCSAGLCTAGADGALRGLRTVTAVGRFRQAGATGCSGGARRTTGARRPRTG